MSSRQAAVTRGGVRNDVSAPVVASAGPVSMLMFLSYHTS